MGIFLFRFLDRDEDGKITREDLAAFFRAVDRDGDGALTRDEFRSFARGEMERRERGEAEARPGVEKSPESVAASNALREARERDSLPGEGAEAPDFHLKLLEGSNLPDVVAPDGDGKVRLSDHKGKKPVVLIFGSYT